MTEIEFKMIAVKITSVKNASLARNIVTKRDFAWLGSETNNGAYYYLLDMIINMKYTMYMEI